MLKQISTCVTLISLVAAPAAAQDAAQGAPQSAAQVAPQDAAQGAPQNAPPKWYDSVEFHGLVDAYYSANLDQAQSKQNPLRAFDVTNDFQVSYVKLTAQLTPPKAYSAGFRADVGFGQTASVLLFKSPLNPSIGDVVIQQAYVSYKFPKDIVLDAGRFVTNAGAEVIEAKDNWLYSRSLLFGFAIPFTHTGVRATVPIQGAPGLSVMAALFNGWDNPPKSIGHEKMGHLALNYTGPASTTVTLNAFYGKNPYESHDRFLFDGVIGRSFGVLSLNVNGDYGKLGSASYWGVAGMARVAFFADRFRISGRGEYLDDSDGIQVTPGVGNKYWEGTLGLSVPIGSNAEFRLEGRQDRVNTGDLIPGKSYSTTIQTAALCWF